MSYCIICELGLLYISMITTYFLKKHSYFYYSLEEKIIIMKIM